MNEDVSTFDITREYDEPGRPDATSKIALRRQNCTAWSPGVRANTTVVYMSDGRVHRVNIPFGVFHTWAIGPAAEQDRARAERATGEKVRKGKTK